MAVFIFRTVMNVYPLNQCVYKCGVGLNIAVNIVSDVSVIKNIGYLFSNLKLDKVGVGADKCLFKASSCDFGCDCVNRAFAVVTGFIEYESVCRFSFLLY